MNLNNLNEKHLQYKLYVLIDYNDVTTKVNQFLYQ